MARWLPLLAWLVALPAAAQGTGGSYGSSNFGGGGGGTSSGGSSSSWGGSSSGESSEPSRPPSAVTFTIPDRALGAALAPAIVVPEAEESVREASTTNVAYICCIANPLIILSLLGIAWRTGPTAEERAAIARRRREGPCEVRRISIGFDWTARAQLQAALAQLASRYADAGSEGRRESAADIAAQLQSALGAARFAHFQSFRLQKPACQQKFAELAVDLRARFRRETRGPRAGGGAAPEIVARADEGAGLVVISVIVATDQHMAPLPETLDRSSVAAAISTIRSIRARTVYGIEVVWSPAEEQDRLSSLELESLYPELLPIEDAPRLGRVVCGYCRAPYPSELPRCPGCGAAGGPA